MATATPALFLFADLLLDGKFAEFLIERREDGDSWDTIAKKLWVLTDQKVDVSGPTLQRWFDRVGAA